MKKDMYEELMPMFNPKKVAVIGASRKKGKIGHSVYKTIKKSLKEGEVHPVNPKARKINGDNAYKSVKEVPGEIDLAVIVVPAKFVPAVVKECGEKGVKGAVVITSGFSEIGKKELEEELKKEAEEASIRIIGPNCLGILDNLSGLNTLFLPEEKLGRPKKGKIGIISQSGAVGSVIVDWASAENYGLSRFISYGNGVDIDERELIRFLGRDEETDVICLYLEGTDDGRQLMESLKEVTPKKPVIILKAGKTSQGSRAVASHTGSLAGSAEVYEAAFKQTGTIQARNMLDMMDYAEAFEKQPLPDGKKVAIVTNGGGFGVLSTDEVIIQGLEMAEFKPKTKKKLEGILPDYGKVNNPLDLMGDAGPKSYSKALKVLEKTDEVDMVLCVELFQTLPMNEKAVKPVLKFNKNSPKPIIVCTAGGEMVQRIKKKLENGGVPVFNTPHRAVDAMKALVKYKEVKDY